MATVYTIGEPGDQVEGYVVFGAKSIDEAKSAITEFDNDIVSFPAHEAFVATKCRLECFACGRAHKEPNQNCDGDEESLIWNFNAPKSGRNALVVWMDGNTAMHLADLSVGH